MGCKRKINGKEINNNKLERENNKSESINKYDILVCRFCIEYSFSKKISPILIAI
ncbi:hypothetical protein TRIP_D260086 [uncultured Paludibacter sp.]|uniref:Uncharacterized protein n=1 Tax=uncultured Paludibacter sp. TaxID=497635 RepID=A0A653AAI3_9BACT|nr:hypothetical protein TRIP_D260086 [uncultured Paludibacter sp.]